MATASFDTEEETSEDEQVFQLADDEMPFCAQLPLKEPFLCSCFCQYLPQGLRWWIQEAFWPGLGLFGESYMLFSIGTLKPLWAELFPRCFKAGGCPKGLLDSINYSVVLGVVTGMLLLGYEASIVGRRRGSIITASLMTLGAFALTVCTYIPDQIFLFRCMSFFLFIFGVGVGGEYPLAASSASEKAMGEMNERMKRELEEENKQADGLMVIDEYKQLDDGEINAQMSRRGWRIQLVFSMQGLGILCNSLVMAGLLLYTGQTSDDDYDETALLFIWRTMYTIGSLVLLFVLITRILYLHESKVWEDDKNRHDQIIRLAAAKITATTGDDKRPDVQPAKSNLSRVSSVSDLSTPSVDANEAAAINLKEAPPMDPEDNIKTNSIGMLLWNFGARLFAASFCWFLWDVAFYGNKLFQSSFLLALTGNDTSLFYFSLAASVNSAVAFAGYLSAAIIIDKVGRASLQMFGLFLTGSLFVACSFLFDYLDSIALVAIYLCSSFFGQMGPNATTFLIPAEIFPTQMRTFCHGVSAASGKLGALVAAISFNYLSAMDMFLFAGYASFAACVITLWGIPETSGLDLYEIDRKWRLIIEGRKRDYEGDADNPKYLSYHERHIRVLRCCQDLDNLDHNDL